LVNSVRKPEGIQQQLVTIPAQYKATSDSLGIERKMTELTYTVYYSITNDYVPPSIWSVQQMPDTPTTIGLSVEVTDFSANVIRVVATYTVGDGLWQTVDLVAAQGNMWRTPVIESLPRSETLEFFIQAVDNSGNVAVHDNKGQYFGLSQYEIFMPIVLNN
jgi:predicted phage tail protein